MAECSLCGMLVADLEASAQEGAPTANALANELSDRASGLGLEPGDMAGRYRIVAAVGEGAMGVVYEAEDPKLRRRVAIKALKLSVADERAGAMLREEGRSAGQLQHPNVVPVFDFGRCRIGWFIAMEFVDGLPLSTWCVDKPWTLIVDRFIEAARGLAEAHRAGVVHRDFKPTNVLVGSDDRARVADFGIAIRPVRAGSSQTLEESASGPREVRGSATDGVIGTPAYMAPEQLEGDPATPRSDQFAFFVALFEMLEGVRPFSGKSRTELLEARSGGARALERRDLPPALHTIICVGLAFDPERRHPSMETVANALAGVRKPRSRGWAWMSVAAASLVAGALLLVPSSGDSCKSTAAQFETTWEMDHAPALRDRWRDELPSEILSRLERRLDGFVREWSAEYTASCGSPTVRSASVQRCLDHRATDFEAALAVALAQETLASTVMDVAIDATPPPGCSLADPPSAGNLAIFAISSRIDHWNARARSLYTAERFDESLALLTEHWDVIQRYGTDRQRAYAAFTRGSNEVTQPDKSLGFERLADAHSLATGSGADALAADIGIACLTLVSTMEPASTDAWMQRVRADVERSGDPRSRARFQLAVAKRARDRGQLEGAIEAALAANTLIEEHPGNDDLSWQVSSLRGYVALARRDYEDAVIHFETSLDQLRFSTGVTSIRSLPARSGLIQAALGTGDVEVAAMMLLEHTDILETTQSDSRSSWVTLRILNAMFFETVGDLDGTLAELEALSRDVDSSEDNWDVAWTRLGLAQLRIHDYSAAREIFERVRVQQEARLGSSSLPLAITLHNLAESESGAGRHDRAVAHYRETLSIAGQSEAGTPVRAYALTGLAEAEFVLGNLEQALAHLEEALSIEHDDEAERAEARASLARVLWRIGGDEHRARALDLAEQASATLESIPGREVQALELSRWLETL